MLHLDKLLLHTLLLNNKLQYFFIGMICIYERKGIFNIDATLLLAIINLHLVRVSHSHLKLFITYKAANQSIIINFQEIALTLETSQLVDQDKHIYGI